MPSRRRPALLVVALLATGCGNEPERRASTPRPAPEATVAQWVRTGDCGLWTDRNVAQGYSSVAEGRRACQEQADRTPVERYRVQTSHVNGNRATVVLALAGDKRYVFSLVTDARRRWRLDDFEERRPERGALRTREVIEAFEAATGERLEPLRRVSGVYYEVLGFPERDRQLELADRFGIFHIYVAESRREASRIVNGARPDERGIHWRRERLWQAEKRYGNVVLSWGAGATKRTDGRFDQLNRILARAAG